jgi:hypothetical protein
MTYYHLELDEDTLLPLQLDKLKRKAHRDTLHARLEESEHSVLKFSASEMKNGFVTEWNYDDLYTRKSIHMLEREPIEIKNYTVPEINWDKWYRIGLLQASQKQLRYLDYPIQNLNQGINLGNLEQFWNEQEAKHNTDLVYMPKYIFKAVDTYYKNKSSS